MVVGTRVYHLTLRMNLIVCQVNSKGKIVCINPNMYDNNVHQVITTDKNQLVIGWRTNYE